MNATCLVPNGEVRLHDRLYKDEHPDAGGAITAQADDKFQFERHGYFVADRKDHAAVKAVFNKITSLKDIWAK